jgi:hypothetical protein
MFMDEGLFGYTERNCMWETLEESTIMICETAAIKKVISENGFLVENATERYIHFKKLYPDLSERVPQRHIVLIISASDTLQEWI